MNGDAGVNLDVIKVDSQDNKCIHDIYIATWYKIIIKLKTNKDWSCTTEYTITPADLSLTEESLGVFYKAVGANIHSGTKDYSDIFLCTEKQFLWIDVTNKRATLLAAVKSSYRQCKIETNDWNDDGNVDVAVTNFGEDKVIVLMHPGKDEDIYDKTKWTDSSIAIKNPSSIRAVDINGDNHKDFLISSYTDNSVIWYPNEFFIKTKLPESTTKVYIEKTFGSGQIIGTTLKESYETFGGDLDQDGDIDILAIAYNGKKISWFENTKGYVNSIPLNMKKTSSLTHHSFIRHASQGKFIRAVYK